MRIFLRTIIYSSSLVLCFSLMGCDKGIKNKFGEPPNFQVDANTEIDYLTVYYYSLASCMKCHIDSQTPNLSTYKSVVSKIGSIQHTINTGKMPPTGDGFNALSDCQKLVLNTWIARGMPTKDGTNLGAPGNACY